MDALTPGVKAGRTMKYQYCLFDLDGTLTDPAEGITNSVMYALGKYGIHVADRSELFPFIGPPLADSFMKFYGFSEEQAAEAVEYYREYFRAGGIFENKLYEGISQMLAALRAKGVTIALATSKPYEFAVKILRHFSLYEYFDHFGAATMDGRISRKSDVIADLLARLGDVDRSTVLMIGDRDQDINGAKANGLKSVGVLWGYGSREELLGAGADFLAEEPADIPRLIEDRENRNMSEIVIRPAAGADYEAVARIMNQVQEMHVHWRPDIYRHTEELLSRESYESAVAAETMYVAETEGIVIGVMGFMFRHIETPAHVTRDVLFIDSMAVDEPYRGRGVGHAFFEQVKEIAAQKKCDGIELQVNARNKAAYEMYRKCGFTEKSINMELL